MLGITVGILYMMSHDTNCGYKKILGLRGDRTGQGRTKTITRSASWRFLALKKYKTFMTCKLPSHPKSQSLFHKNTSSHDVHTMTLHVPNKNFDPPTPMKMRKLMSSQRSFSNLYCLSNKDYKKAVKIGHFLAFHFFEAFLCNVI